MNNFGFQNGQSLLACREEMPNKATVVGDHTTGVCIRIFTVLHCLFTVLQCLY